MVITLAVEQRQFRFLNCVGSGGFGEVYRVEMKNMGGVSTEVAIKILHKELCPTNQAVQRLRDEAHMLGMLQHPSILRVFDLVDIDGRLALITEFVDGVDLEQTLEDRDALSTRALMDVVGQVAGALDAAKNTISTQSGQPLNLVHRDVKPANIRLGKHGEVKLLDFGIATAAGVTRQAKTRAGDVIGSYRYMAPERLTASHADTPAADVYSLGQVLYEGLMGRRLFSGSDLRQQIGLAEDQGMHDHFVRKKLDTLDAPASVRAVLRTMLAHDPRLRPEAGKLSALCEEESESLSGGSLRKWCRMKAWRDLGNRPGALSGRTIIERVVTPPQESASEKRRDLTLMTFDDSDLDEGPTKVPFDFPTEDSVPSLSHASVASGDGPPPPPNHLGPSVTPLPMRRTDLGRLAARSSRPEASPKPSRGPNSWVRAFLGLFIGFGSFGLALAGLVLAAGVAWYVGVIPVGPSSTIDEVPLPAVPVYIPIEDVEVEVAPAAPEPEVSAPSVAPPPQARSAPEEVVLSDSEGDEAPKTGRVSVSSTAPVQLRRTGEVSAGGQIPVGEWQVYADFGSGWELAMDQPLSVEEGASHKIRCSTLKEQCFQN